MAIQKGGVKLSGRSGNLIFFQRNGKTCSRTVVENKFQTEGSKLSARRFSMASSFGASIRRAFAPLVKFYGDDKLVCRLTGQIKQIIDQIPDARNIEPSLIAANITLLSGFEFNENTRFENLWFGKSSVEITKSGVLKFSLTGGNLEYLLKMPKQATTAHLEVMAFCVDLVSKHQEVHRYKPLSITLNKDQFYAKSISLPFALDGEQAVFIAAGICYHAEGQVFRDRNLVACKIVHALRISNGAVVHFERPIEVKPVMVVEDKLADWDE